jgi:hypothetical protein
MARVIHATTMNPTIAKLRCRLERKRREPDEEWNDNAENLADNDNARVWILQRSFGRQERMAGFDSGHCIAPLASPSRAPDYCRSASKPTRCFALDSRSSASIMALD